jgi:hypothetical protein
MIAALSPQTDWFSNIAVADFMAKTLHADPVLNLPPNVLEYVTAKAAATRSTKAVIRQGEHFSAMTPEEAAWGIMGMIRAAKLKSEDKIKSGQPRAASVSMGTGSMAKAIRMFRGEKPEEVLSGHKVRSFFNNILDPDDLQHGDDVTIDTHAVSAAALARIGAKSKTIDKMYANISKLSANVKSAYPMFADAYRRLAQRHGLLSNQAQALIWTHWQSNFSHVGERENPKYPDAP